MTAPIIPGIDDARAREIAKFFSIRCAVLATSINPSERGPLKAAKLISPKQYDGWYLLTPSGKTLWERIKTDDRG